MLILFITNCFNSAFIMSTEAASPSLAAENEHAIRLDAGIFRMYAVRNIIASTLRPTTASTKKNDHKVVRMGMLATSGVLELAERWYMHPQSVLGLARMTYGRWKRGHTYMLVELERQSDDTVTYIERVDFEKTLPAYVENESPARLKAMDEYMWQDQLNFMYKLDQSPNEVHIYSHGALFTKAQLHAFRKELTNVRELGVQWHDNLVTEMHQRISPRLLMEFCLYAVHYVNKNTADMQELVVRFDRERSSATLKTGCGPTKKAFVTNGPGLKAVLMAMSKDEKYVIKASKCSQCERMSRFSCTYCTECIWCSEACAVANWDSHSKACVAWQMTRSSSEGAETQEASPAVEQEQKE
jgi:hypothetical protein